MNAAPLDLIFQNFSMNFLSIFIHQNVMACFVCDKVGQWSLRRIEGEALTKLPQSNAKSKLSRVLNEIKDQFNLPGNNLQGTQVHVFYDQAGVDCLTELPKVFKAMDCAAWQILRLEPLLERACSMETMPPLFSPSVLLPLDDETHAQTQWFMRVVLPVVSSTFFYSSEAVAAELERVRRATKMETQRVLADHEETLDSLRAERQALEEEKHNLVQQVQAMQRLSMENLITYMPVFYRNFFSKIKPSDLALLVGSLTPPDLGSTFTEPDGDTVLVLRKRFLNLPESERHRVVDFCRQLTHPLEVRPEMRDLLERA